MIVSASRLSERIRRSDRMTSPSYAGLARTAIAALDPSPINLAMPFRDIVSAIDAAHGAVVGTVRLAARRLYDDPRGPVGGPHGCRHAAPYGRAPQSQPASPFRQSGSPPRDQLGLGRLERVRAVYSHLLAKAGAGDVGRALGMPQSNLCRLLEAAVLIGDYVVNALGRAGPHVVLARIFLVSAVISQFISNTSAALVMMPIGLARASELGVSALPMMMGVAMGASASFLTPFANGVSLMVYGPGGYRFGDFWKLGLIVMVWTLIVTMVVIPLYWKF